MPGLSIFRTWTTNWLNWQRLPFFPATCSTMCLGLWNNPEHGRAHLETSFAPCNFWQMLAVQRTESNLPTELRSYKSSVREALQDWRRVRKGATKDRLSVATMVSSQSSVFLFFIFPGTRTRKCDLLAGKLFSMRQETSQRQVTGRFLEPRPETGILNESGRETKGTTRTLVKARNLSISLYDNLTYIIIWPSNLLFVGIAFWWTCLFWRANWRGLADSQAAEHGGHC